MELLDVYYINELYYLVVNKKDEVILTLNDIGELKTVDSSFFVLGIYKGNVNQETGLIRLFR